MTSTPAPTPGRSRPPRSAGDAAALARAAVTEAHVQPSYDLASQNWLPVLQAGAVRHVGLRELLTSAHQIDDIAVPHPLQRAGLRRLLEALTVDLVRADQDRDRTGWEHAHAANSGFTSEQVDALLQRHEGHLHLWHPTSPFLQDRRLLTALTKPQADLPAQDLVLHLPSASALAWWRKAEEPALRTPLHPAQTTMWLISRWFYGSNGNCADTVLPDGTVLSSQQGGAFAETVAPLTHLWRLDPISLFRSLLRGLPSRLLTTPPPGPGGCAWVDLQQPRPSADPLYLATLNPAAVLLAAHDDDGAVTRVLRGAAPVPAQAGKQLRDLALNADQHRILTTHPTSGATTAVRVPPNAGHPEALRVLHRAGLEGRPLHGTINSGDCWLAANRRTVDRERLDLLVVGPKGGTGSSPVWQDLAGLELPARHVDPAHPDPVYAEHVRAAVRVAFDPQNGVRPRLERALQDLLAQPDATGWQRPRRDSPAGRTVQVLLDQAYDGWQRHTETALQHVLDDPTEQALTVWSQAAWAAARDAFTDVARPYTTSTRFAPRYAAARRWLTPRSST